ncbi:calcium-binding protein [uncultured Sulfitobacter sp.]|jgi:Ca2+-binding RTX toxin-like protein|uniref:calcium-binding protein n=1 Tax=uncultured Sulfitobacter sp. TaxID=191468 RepID=UPI0030D70786
MGRIIRSVHLSWAEDGSEPDAPGPVQGATLPWFHLDGDGGQDTLTFHAGRGLWSGAFTLSNGVLRYQDSSYQRDSFIPFTAGNASVAVAGDLFDTLLEDAGGSLINARTYFSQQSGSFGDTGQMLAVEFGASTMVVASIAGRAGLSVFDYANAGDIQRRATVNDNDTLFLGNPVGLTCVEQGGLRYVYAASSGDEAGISAFRLSSSGQLNAVGRLEVEDGLWVSNITQLEGVTAGGQNYLLVAAAGSGSLSVVALDEGGAMRVSDHVLDDLDTRFDDITVMETLMVGDQAYVAVSGADQGVSLFQLLPNGQLLHLETLADTQTLGLGHINALSLVAQNGMVHLIASSENEPGLTHVTYDPGDGLLLLGDDRNNTLTGSTAEDILLDGAGTDRLTGGDGADLFVLARDGQIDTIMDFQVGLDRVDLSAWSGLYSTHQIEVISRSDGAEVRYGDERLILRTDDQRALDLEDFLATDMLGIARLTPIEERPENLVLRDGTEEGDLLEGGTPDNIINGLGGDDQIFGRDGNDSLNGGEGHDLLDGGNGQDTLEGGAGHDRLTGGESADILRGGTGADTLEGAAGNDQLWGDSSTDLLYGGTGNDTLTGGTGADTLHGGGGNDRLLSNTGVDLIYGGAGHDWISPGNGVDIVYGEGGNDTIIGRTGWDTLDGGTGDDALYGSEGRDALQGGLGNDYLSGGFGYDTLEGGAGNDALYGNIGMDELHGGDGNDAMFGATGDDLLRGGAGDDELFGAQGRDTLEGGAGDDFLRGGTLADTFIFNAGHGQDRLSGLELQDEVHLSVALTQGLTRAEDIVSRFARVVEDDVVLWFSRDNQIVFEDGVTAADLTEVILTF